MDINETKIKEMLRVEQKYANEAMRMADQGYGEKTCELVAMVVIARNNIDSMLMGITPGKRPKLVPVTDQMIQSIEEHNYFEKEARNIYNNCIKYCGQKLGDHELRKMLN